MSCSLKVTQYMHQPAGHLYSIRMSASKFLHRQLLAKYLKKNMIYVVWFSAVFYTVLICVSFTNSSLLWYNLILFGFQYSLVLNISAQNEQFGPCFQTIFPFLVTVIIPNFEKNQIVIYKMICMKQSYSKKLRTLLLKLIKPFWCF